MQPIAPPALRTVTVLALAWLGASLAAQPTGAQAPGPHVVGGPYAVNVRPRSATVMWVVQTGQASLGTELGSMEKAVPLLRAEKIEFYGLKPGTTYYYESFPGPGGKGSFKTPPVGPAPFQFVVFGDTRTRHDVHRAVVSAILNYASPDFVMHTGDLVEDGRDASLWPIFFDVERELLRGAAFYPALGNHERDASNYYELMNAKRYYSFDWGGVHFSVVDSDIANVASNEPAREAFWQEQTHWLEADLRSAANASLRFVFAHHPPITAVKRRQGDNPQMIALEPMFEQFKVTAAFFGHDHNYQHYLKNGIHYFITGGGGAPLYDVDMPPPGITKKVERTENFVTVKVDGGRAHIEARKPSGEVIDVADIGQQ
ncbi:MAG: metallophosphoesterase [Acidobacteriota bacterium]